MSIDFFTVIQPFRNLNTVFCISIIHKNYCTVVPYMTYNTTNRLVNSSLGLQFVPALSVESTVTYAVSLVKVFLFDQYFRIEYLRVRYPCHYNTSSCIVSKINTFGKLTSTNSKKCGFAQCLNCLQVCLQHNLIFCLVLIFNKYLSVLTQFFKHLVLSPHFFHFVQHRVCRHKDQNTAFHLSKYFNQSVSNI